MFQDKDHIKFKDYQLEDFLTDEFFIQWVKNPNENTTHFWEKWIEANAQKKEIVMQAATFIRSIDYQEKHLMKNEIYLEVFEKIIRVDLKEVSQKKNSIIPFHWKSILSLRNIAAILILTFCSWIFYSLAFKRSIVKEDPIEWITKVNRAGIKTVLTLEDGSRIHLNSSSKITYPNRFSDTIRSVLLEGEAFFDVAEESRPFVVDLGKAQIEVLGTTFNAKKSSENKLEVALVSGKVKVNDRKGNQVMLMPSEMLTIQADGEFHKSKFDSLEIIGWKDKILVFRDDDFITVKSKIENWYDVEVKLSGKLSTTWAYTGNFHDESLRNVLEGIKQTSKIKYKINGKKVELYN
ncbi:FecR family protein [Algoriphagus antarcticus]|uniref:FecR family protein n=1 Tax=Algoriphagus antarcticus TaxID=238540 RepID=A0A3E0E7A4_9BACT|nr:FecR family protein [Algoriphagus antarcticus]REG92876.1 FecR family protein [Algoriphagus antarcticus]